MPLYEFVCEKHGRFEELCGRGVELADCPVCRRVSTKVFSLPAPHVVDFRPGWNGGAGQHFDTKRERDNWVSMSGSRRIR